MYNVEKGIGKYICILVLVLWCIIQNLQLTEENKSSKGWVSILFSFKLKYQQKSNFNGLSSSTNSKLKTVKKWKVQSSNLEKIRKWQYTSSICL